MTELVKINPTEFGLTEETASNITKGLDQILSERAILTTQYAEVIVLDIDAPKTAKAPIKKQLGIWVDSFELPVFPTQHDKADEITAKFEAFKNWAKSQVENI
jgi:hypothetical protein